MTPMEIIAIITLAEKLITKGIAAGSKIKDILTTEGDIPPEQWERYKRENAKSIEDAIEERGGTLEDEVPQADPKNDDGGDDLPVPPNPGGGRIESEYGKQQVTEPRDADFKTGDRIFTRTYPDGGRWYQVIPAGIGMQPPGWTLLRVVP